MEIFKIPQLIQIFQEVKKLTPEAISSEKSCLPLRFQIKKMNLQVKMTTLIDELTPTQTICWLSGIDFSSPKLIDRIQRLSQNKTHHS
jgi:hypothetical protein